MKTCRYCKQPLNDDPTTKDIEWIKRSQNYYYHKECWDKWLSQDRDGTRTNAEWLDLIFLLIVHDLKKTYNYFQIKSQFEKFLQEGFTGRGIYYTIYYLFNIKNVEFMPQFGIALVRLTYDESFNYWLEREKQKKGIMKQIEDLQVERLKQGVDIKQRKSRKKEINWDDEEND